MTNIPIIALLTDFGLSDTYVGTMKGILLSICPHAQLVDLTHSVEPQNVRQGAYLLLTTFRHFPPHTVFLVVVDPGVGTVREPVAIETNYGMFVAPNNGVLSYILPHVQVSHAVVLQEAAYRLSGASNTFHGRDIFSPAAAHLANGLPITRLGPAVSELIQMDEPFLDRTPGEIRGEVLHIDHFGNIITSIGYLSWIETDRLQLTPQFGPDRSPVDIDALACRVTLGDHPLPSIRPAYGFVARGALVALVGSSGQLEIGMNGGNAAQALGVSSGESVLLSYQP